MIYPQLFVTFLVDRVTLFSTNGKLPGVLRKMSDSNFDD